jgi:hypothetical protein
VVIAGVNLPLLIKLARGRDRESLVDAVVSAPEGGRKYITVASTLLMVGKTDARKCAIGPPRARLGPTSGPPTTCCRAG